MNLVRVFLVGVFMLVANQLLAQKTRIYEDQYRLYREALELYDKEKFVAAQEKFQNFTPNLPSSE